MYVRLTIIIDRQGSHSGGKYVYKVICPGPLGVMMDDILACAWTYPNFEICDVVVFVLFSCFSAIPTSCILVLL